jgi:hypothetical protein
MSSSWSSLSSGPGVHETLCMWSCKGSLGFCLAFLAELALEVGPCEDAECLEEACARGDTLKVCMYVTGHRTNDTWLTWDTNPSQRCIEP